MTKILITLFLTLTPLLSYAQIYMMAVRPLQPGNLWKYYDLEWGDEFNFYVTSEDTLIKGNSYSIVQVYRDTSSHIRNDRYMRRDQDNFYYRYWEVDNFDSLYKYYLDDCNIGDSWIESFRSDNYVFTVVDTVTIHAMGKSFFTKVIYITDGLVEVYQWWNEEIGLMEEFGLAQYDVILRGCVINGVAYGDTTTVSVDEPKIQPNNYFLSQNHPNPFNPSTKILYQIPYPTNVNIDVFDILGNKVATLEEGFKSAGSYEVEFDGSRFSSGIYFYTLRTNNFVETKKMVLLK